MEDANFITKSGRVAEILRLAITSGDTATGDWIRPDDWAARLKISQTPIREALRRLEAEGLVHIYPHRGAQVVWDSQAKFEEVYLMRSVLEALACRLVIFRKDQGERLALCGRLRDLQQDLRRFAAADDTPASRETNRVLHMTLYEAADSPGLLALIQNLWATFPWDTLFLPDRLTHAAMQHDAVIDAIEAGDVVAAEATMREHVEGAALQLLKHDPVSLAPGSADH